ncbi:ABC transporter ATP-binding protein [Cumulibacter soli]|uniref:ABC transporter ATP-binding protein n=1 Tax=Cumulibacter soli TaxID=2546344 RepID=UPI0010680332|nr:ABC transporter ATP-binding protein [Cumulibacter soli]
MNDILDIRGLSRRFGDTLANDDITLSVARGTVLGLLGHNGAGKTTLVSQIAGLLRPHSGSIRVAGIDALAAPARARRHLALQPQGQAPIDGLTVRTAIELSARVRGAPPAAARAAADQLGEELDITQWLDQRALPDGRGISGGIRRLTTFAMTIASPTALLILDEPSNDVDAARRSLLWEAVRRRADAGAAVLLVTHNVSEAERIVDDLAVLQAGRLVAQGSPIALRGTQGTDLRLDLQFAPHATDVDVLAVAGPPDAEDHPTRPFGCRRTVRSGRRILLQIGAADAAAAVSWACDLRAAKTIDGFSLGPATLEESYLALTATEQHAEEPV